MWNVFGIAIIGISVLSLSSCLDEGTSIGVGGSKVVYDPDSSAERKICDPFHSHSQSSRENGLYGSLFYLDENQTKYKNVEEYISNGTRVDAGLYLDRLYVPTRPFDRGFTTDDGELITVNNNKLYEYFAIDVTSQLKLGENEAPGYYQLALISDDGALLKTLDGEDNEFILVNNNGIHPTKMACATEPIYMDRNTRLPIRLQYYQGPKYHISMIAMWRPWPGPGSADKADDFYCGKGGNGLFFEFSKDPVVPKKPFYELLARNWKVLENENYEFPSQDDNPCAPAEETLALSGFSITSVGRNQVSVTWLSNIPASGQLEVKNVSTGAVVRSSLRPELLQYHDMTITGLSPNTLYSVRAISSTAGGQTVMTDERAFRTPR